MNTLRAGSRVWRAIHPKKEIWSESHSIFYTGSVKDPGKTGFATLVGEHIWEKQLLSVLTYGWTWHHAQESQ